MPVIKSAPTIARRILPILYVIDNSGSMSGDKMDAVNKAMKGMSETLKDVSASNPDAQVKIAAMSFSDEAKWLTPGFQDLEDFIWKDLDGDAGTDYGAAIEEIEDKLCRHGYLKSEIGFCMPVIIFMSDGAPNDDDWIEANKRAMENNNWYKHAIKIAIAIGSDADTDVLTQLVGNPESVIMVDDVDTLKRLIAVISVTSSMIGSKSRTSGDIDPNKQIANAAVASMEGEGIQQAGTSSDAPAPATMKIDDDGNW